MTAPFEIVEHSATAPTDAHRRRQAVVALLIACAFWGGSFSWAKSAMAGINLRVGRDASDALGVLVLLAVRFTLAGIFWLIALPQARHGWSKASVGRAIL